MSGDWVVLIPLKRLHMAKSRLLLPRHGQRAHVVRAMAETVALTASQVPGVRSVAVVTDENWDQHVAPALVIREPPESGLNPALCWGAQVIQRLCPGRGVAILPGDAAAMTEHELQACLEAAAPYGRALVADHLGTGTVLLTAAAGVPVEPMFGVGSRRAHVRSGAVDLTAGLDVPLLRRDLDTADDLDALHERLRELPRLDRALRRAGWTGPADRPTVATIDGPSGRAAVARAPR